MWKPVKGYEGLYEISDKGLVKRLERRFKDKNGRAMYFPEKMMVPTTKDTGYVIFMLSKGKHRKHKFLHRLLAETFIPNPNNLPMVNHLNCIKGDNRLDNLEWCDRARNNKHAYDFVSRGKIAQVRGLVEQGFSDVEIEKMIN